MSLRWAFQPFDALALHELYALLRLRSEVFVVEQQCVFLDLDNSDQQAWHLMGWRGADTPELAAVARCFGPGVKCAEASIGRVVTAPPARGAGLGHTLMREALRVTRRQWGAVPVRIGAQAHLQAFYAQHGFVQTGQPYIEDGIPHIEMLRPASHGDPHVE